MTQDQELELIEAALRRAKAQNADLARVCPAEYAERVIDYLAEHLPRHLRSEAELEFDLEYASRMGVPL